MIERHTTASAFLEAAGPFLAEREAEHNLLFGITANLRVDEDHGVPPSHPPYLATIVRDGTVVGAALMTPPFNLVLSCMDDPTDVDEVVADVDTFEPHPPGVLGPIDLAKRFAIAWCRPRDLIARRSVAERIYRVERVIPPVGVPGSRRVATIADRDLLYEWMRGFMHDAFERPDDAQAHSMVDRALDAGQRTFHLWEVDGRPVSTAAVGGPTPNGIRVGPVYTPPQDRGHGFASAVTAAATQAALDAGCRFVFLFTDLANPTSNKIYQAIGYEPVIDVDQVRFEHP